MYTKTWVNLFVECHVINSLLEVLRHGTCEGRIGGDSLDSVSSNDDWSDGEFKLTYLPGVIKLLSNAFSS